MISLRQFQSSDTQALVEILNNPLVSKYLSSKIPNPYTESDASWWIEEGSQLGYIRAISLEDKLVGCVGVTPGEHEYQRSGEVGYWLSRAYWGQGITTQAVNLICAEVFANTELNRIFAAVFSANSRSMKVLTNCGFKPEAVLTQAIYKDGQFYDNHIFSKLR